MSEREQPTLPGRGWAHRFIDFLWDEVHISSGAFVLIVIGFLFTIGVYKIDHSAIDQQKKVTQSVCHVVDGANQGVGATKVRLQAAIDRDKRQAKAESQIKGIWVYALKNTPLHSPKSQRRLLLKLIHAQGVLASEDRQAASDLQKQLDAVKPIHLAGC